MRREKCPEDVTLEPGEEFTKQRVLWEGNEENPAVDGEMRGMVRDKAICTLHPACVTCVKYVKNFCMIFFSHLENLVFLKIIISKILFIQKAQNSSIAAMICKLGAVHGARK